MIRFNRVQIFRITWYMSVFGSLWKIIPVFELNDKRHFSNLFPHSFGIPLRVCGRDSLVSTVTRLRARWPEFDSRQEQGLFLFAATSRPALGLTQPPVQWVLIALFPEVKRPGREANHSPLSSAEVKNAWSYASMACCLVKHRYNFTCPLPIKITYFSFPSELHFQPIIFSISLPAEPHTLRKLSVCELVSHTTR
jgi:hypothetical protein